MRQKTTHFTRLLTSSALAGSMMTCFLMPVPAFAMDCLKGLRGCTDENALRQEAQYSISNMSDLSVQETKRTHTVMPAHRPFYLSADVPVLDNKDAHDGTLQYPNSDLKNMAIRFKVDGLSVSPQLNVIVKGEVVTALRSQDIYFKAFWNYGAFIQRAELRVMAVDASTRRDPLIILPVLGGYATLPAHVNLPDELIYVLRVYDTSGRYDETKAKPLTLLEELRFDEMPTTEEKPPSAYAVDHTAVRNIRVYGSTITVQGDQVPEGSTVTFMQKETLVDDTGGFVVQEILPFGVHPVGVEVQYQDEVVSVKRNIKIENTEFFYVALGDLTLGAQNSDGPTDFLIQSDEGFDGTYASGRGAMYLRGRIKGKYGVTAAIDTGEERLRDIFTNLDKKDSRQLLRRLDADRFYPVYGDQSTLVEDAPTQGKFYVRVEKDDSHVLFGNFVTQITDTDLAQLDRGLYGGIIDYKSLDLTNFGDRRTHVTGFAADPGTIPARSEFRGTGGSLYFLDRQDITIGSERLRVEIRDKVSGLVIETRDLRPQADYDIDYIQGRVILSEPLYSTAADNQIVRDGGLSGNDVFLVVRYEYTPTVVDISGYTLGGRATRWLNDDVRFGVTAQTEQTQNANQELLGIDILLRHSEDTYFKGEFANTNGPAFGQFNSTDGGFNFNEVSSPGIVNVDANAYRFEGRADFSDISELEGSVHAYYDHQDAGFSGVGRLTASKIRRWGARIDTSLSDAKKITLKYDQVDAETQGSTRAFYGSVTQKLNKNWAASIGVRHDEREVTSTGLATGASGQRTDGSIQLDYTSPSDWGGFTFAQFTLHSDGERRKNNRIGFGGNKKFTDKLKISGEVSSGDGGLGAGIQAAFTRSERSEYYLGYALSPDGRDTAFEAATHMNDKDGTLTFGARTRYSDALSVYGEERLSVGSRQAAYTHAYGLTYNPTDLWAFGASVENGIIEDVINGNIDRTAVTLSAGRVSDLWRFSSKLEGRFEESDDGTARRDRTTWLMRNTAALTAAEDWELLARLNFAFSESDEANILDADFTEGVIAAAYRPVKNDKLNGLLKYTYFEDLAPAGQLSAGGANNTVRQRSQIFSVDVVYDLTNKISLAGKYGFRKGEVSFDRINDTFIKSDAQLMIFRLDYHVLRKWDMLGEMRLLNSSLAADQKFGTLIGVYRHVGKHTKIGVGYNFTKFSDDLTDFDNESGGAFINFVGKL